MCILSFEKNRLSIVLHYFNLYSIVYSQSDFKGHLLCFLTLQVPKLIRVEHNSSKFPLLLKKLAAVVVGFFQIL